jgi:hypothetical protein
MMVATLLGAIDVTAALFWALRVAAGVGGALVGWFVTGPVARLLYRGAFQRPAPGWLLPWARLSGAALVGLLVFYLLPLGGGSGFGWGPGGGAGPGQGAGTGKPSVDQTAPGDKHLPQAANDVEALEIELVGGTRYPGGGRFYLINRREPTVALEDVEDYVKKHQERLAEYVTIVLTPQSVDAGHRAVLRLNTIIEKYHRRPQIKDVDGQSRKANKQPVVE